MQRNPSKSSHNEHILRRRQSVTAFTSTPLHTSSSLSDLDRTSNELPFTTCEASKTCNRRRAMGDNNNNKPPLWSTSTLHSRTDSHAKYTNAFSYANSRISLSGAEPNKRSSSANRRIQGRRNSECAIRTHEQESNKTFQPINEQVIKRRPASCGPRSTGIFSRLYPSPKSSTNWQSNLAQPPPSNYILREDSDFGVPVVISNTLKSLGWTIYEEERSLSSSLEVSDDDDNNNGNNNNRRRRSTIEMNRSLNSVSSTNLRRGKDKGHYVPTPRKSTDNNNNFQTFPPYHIHWRSNRFFPSDMAACTHPFMRVNHFPISSEITKKDKLYLTMRKMKVMYGSIYTNMMPETFTLPNEYLKFCKYYTEQRDVYTNRLEAYKRDEISRNNKKWQQKDSFYRSNSDIASDVGLMCSSSNESKSVKLTLPTLPIYICKPTDMSRGRKIFVFNDLSDLVYDQCSLVQSYIDRPLLIHGHKVDFRIYILLTSMHPNPIEAFIYRNFLMRFSSEKYDESNLWNTYSHLTNYSISKTSPNICSNDIGEACKWGGDQVRSYFKNSYNINFDEVIWPRIMMCVNLTLLGLATASGASLYSPPGPSFSSCFELYGFDILLDTKCFQPWLVEVNYSPSLAIDTPLDKELKSALIADMVGVLNIPLGPSMTQETAKECYTIGKRTVMPASKQKHHCCPYGQFVPCFPPIVDKEFEGSCAYIPFQETAAGEKALQLNAALANGVTSAFNQAMKALILELRKVEHKLGCRCKKEVLKYGTHVGTDGI